MKHLLDIQQLTQQDVYRLVERAFFFKTHTDYPTHRHCPLATLFYENSTRTRMSFELAAKQLSFPIVHFDAQTSSEAKGEVIDDTFQTLKAMGIRLFVIRHQQNGLPALMAERYGHDVHIVNAGDGQHAHPSQALLDYMTIIEEKGAFDTLKVAIVGDIRHSRVAHSFQHLCALMGVKALALIAPPIWQPESVHYGQLTSSLQEGLTDADVVICLRVQRERLKTSETLDMDEYYKQYTVTQHTLVYAKPDAIVMHPGPINRGVEIESHVADGPQSVILKQVQNGVFMRMAILDALVQN